MEAVIAAVRAAPRIEVREGVPRCAACCTTRAGRVRGVLARDASGALVEIVAPATRAGDRRPRRPLCRDHHPGERARRGPGPGGAGRRGDRRPRVRAVPPHRHRHRPRPRAAGHRGAARRRRECWSNADGAPFMAALPPAAELAPRDVVARAIHAERRGRARRLPRRPRGGRRALPATSSRPCSPPAWPRASIRAVQPIPVAPAAHYHMGGIATDARGPHHPGRPLRRRRVRLDRRARRQPPGLQLAAGSRRLRRPRAGRGRRRRRRSGDAPPAGRRPRPTCRTRRLQTLRRAMSRDAGVVRDAAGLTRPARPRSTRWRRAHGRGACRWSPRGWSRQAALARRESRGGHFRADYPRASAPPVRTFVHARRGRASAVAARLIAADDRAPARPADRARRARRPGRGPRPRRRRHRPGLHPDADARLRAVLRRPQAGRDRRASPAPAWPSPRSTRTPTFEPLVGRRRGRRGRRRAGPRRGQRPRPALGRAHGAEPAGPALRRRHPDPRLRRRRGRHGRA